MTLATLDGLPTDIILSIVLYAEPTSSMNLVQTCKNLYDLNSTTGFWISLAASIRKYRPVPIQGANSLAAIRQTVLTALNLHDAWVLNGEFTIQKSKLLPMAQIPYNDNLANARWDPWIKFDTEGQLFFHTDMPKRVLVRKIENGLVLWTIHAGGVVQFIKSVTLGNRTVILIHVEYAGEDIDDVSALEIWDTNCLDEPVAVHKINGFFRELMAHDGWVYFSAKETSIYTMLVLNLRTLESTIVTLPLKNYGQSWAEASRHLGCALRTSPLQLVATYTWPTFIDVEIFSLDTSTSSASLLPALVELNPFHTLHIDLPPIDPLGSHYDFASPGFMDNGKLSLFNLICCEARSGNGHHRFYSLIIDLPIEGEAVLEGISHIADSPIEKMSTGTLVIRFGEHNQSIAWLSRDEKGISYLSFIDFTNVYPFQHQPPEAIRFRGNSAKGPGYGAVSVPDSILKHGNIQSLAFDDARGRILLAMSTGQVAVLYLV